MSFEITLAGNKFAVRRKGFKKRAAFIWLRIMSIACL
jgi:hypothetical protein